MTEGLKLERLSHVVLATTDLAADRDFFTDVLGIWVVGERDGAVYLRSDMRSYSIVLEPQAGADAVGFEVRDAAMLDEAEVRLTKLGFITVRGGADDVRRRNVKAMVTAHDATGNRVELVWRPFTAGWRFHGTRDHGLQGLQSVALRSRHIDADERLWIEGLGAEISDWIGDAVYLRTDDRHHRVALHPSTGLGVLHVALEVAGIDDVMRAANFLRDRQVSIQRGPGREPTSGRIFLSFASPTGRLVTLATEMEQIPASRVPRQLPASPSSHCQWGSESRVPELGSYPGEP